MQSRTQSPWQAGAHVLRPQHSTEHSLCFAGEEHAFCAWLAGDKASTATQAASRSAFGRNTIKPLPNNSTPRNGKA